MEKFITYFIYNFTLTFLILGFIFSVVSLIIKKQSLTKKHIIEALFSYYFLFNIGISFLYNFINGPWKSMPYYNQSNEIIGSSKNWKIVNTEFKKKNFFKKIFNF